MPKHILNIILNIILIILIVFWIISKMITPLEVYSHFSFLGIILGAFRHIVNIIFKNLKFSKLNERHSFIFGVVILFLYVLLALVFIFKNPDYQKLELTVFIEPPVGYLNNFLDNTGKLTIEYGEERITKTINNEGMITLDEIPSTLKKKAIRFQLDAKGYILLSEDDYSLNRKPITLKVGIDNNIGRIHGIVKDREGIHLIDSAQIIINSDTIIYSDYLGKFDILLPEEMWIYNNTQGYDLLISKKGYSTEKEKFYPSSDPIEIRLIYENY